MSKYLLIILLAIGNQTYAQEKDNLGTDHPMVLRPKGHRGILWDMQMTPDERYIITAGQDKTIKFWDLDNNLEERGELLGHIGKEKYGANYAVRISPNGKWLATAGFYGDVDQRKYICDIRIYDMTTRALIKILSLHKNVITALRWSKDSRYLISASRDNSIGVWDMSTFQLKTQLKGHGDVVYSADIFNDKVVSGSKDNLIMMWDINTGQSTMTAFDHFATVFEVLFDPAGQYIISGSQDKNINIYDSQLMYVNSYTMDRSISSISFSSDQKHLLVGFDNGQVKIFAYTQGTLTELAAYQPHQGGFVADIVMTKDGRIISGGGAESNLAMYKIKNGKAEEVFSPVMTSQKVYSAGLDGDVLAFAIGKANAYSMVKSVNFTKGFNFVSRDYQDLDEYNNVLTFTMGQGLSDRTAKFKGRMYNYKAPIHTMGSLNGELYENKVVISYQEGGHDDSWTVQKGKFTGFKNGDIVAQIQSNERQQEFTFTPDSLVVIAGSAGYLRAFDLSGKFVTDFVGHEDVVFSVNMSTDRKWLISGSHDHSIRLWEVDQVGKKLELWPAATCHFSNDGEWIVATDGDYYMASTHGGKYVGFHQNQGFNKEAKYYPFENFDLKYNRPDKVLERLDMGSERLRELLYLSYQKRLKKMDIAEDVLSDELSLPVVSINNNTQTVTSKIFTLEVNASDAKYDLNRLNIYINDVPIYGVNGMDLKKSKQAFRKSLELELLPGKNKIQISALNAVGVESLKETKVVFYDAPAVKPELHIVTIGVSNYKDSNYNLDFASKDATDVANLFHGHYERYSKIHLHKFTDALAQREQILAVKEKLNTTSANDEVIIFAAGHGLLDENLDYYFATHDIDFNNPAARGLKFEELEGLLDGIPAGKKLLLVDACHSGEVDKDEVELVKAELERKGVNVRGFAKKPQPVGIDNTFELMQELFADLRRGSGAMVISSASGMEFALESETWKNGVFTYALKEAFSNLKGDLNKDGEIQISELRNYVFDRVAVLTNGLQHPTSRRENLEFDFVVW